MPIEWLTKKDFWDLVSRFPCPHPGPDAYFYFFMPMDEIRARIRTVPPEFTPSDEGDWAGPVERWYGQVDGHRFLLTSHYCNPVPHLVEVDHVPGEEATAIIRAALDAWREKSPY